MNRLTRTATSTLVALSALLITASAWAHVTPPMECSSGRALRQFNSGAAGGVSIVNMAWNSVGLDPVSGTYDADELDRFSDAVINSLAGRLGAMLPPFVSTDAECRVKGFLMGGLDRVYHIQEEVIGQCIMDGAFMGEFYGTMYCELAIELGGMGLAGWDIRPPVGLCGIHFEFFCDQLFDVTTTAYAGCDPFYGTAEWSEYQNNVCLY